MKFIFCATIQSKPQKMPATSTKQRAQWDQVSNWKARDWGRCRHPKYIAEASSVVGKGHPYELLECISYVLNIVILLPCDHDAKLITLNCHFLENEKISVFLLQSAAFTETKSYIPPRFHGSSLRCHASCSVRGQSELVVVRKDWLTGRDKD